MKGIKHIGVAIFVGFMSCNVANETIDIKQSIEILKSDNVGDIPYLMYKNNIDTIYQVLTKGGINMLKTRDTLISYFFNQKEKFCEIKLKSFMCCYTKIHYNSDSILERKTFTTDFTLNFEYKYQFSADEIKIVEYVRKKANRDSDSLLFVPEDTMVYKIKNSLIISRTANLNPDSWSHYFTSYIYNKNNQIIKTISNKLKNANDEIMDIDYDSIITEFSWKGNHLVSMNIRSVKTDKDRGINSDVKEIFFDVNGLPEKEMLYWVNKTDTIKYKYIVR